MIKGVNLGNWLLLEKWMSPAPFAGVGPGRKHQVNGGDRVTGTHRFPEVGGRSTWTARLTT
jgi:hypothetical protein